MGNPSNREIDKLRRKSNHVVPVVLEVRGKAILMDVHSDALTERGARDEVRNLLTSFEGIDEKK
jgi:hypothetical protein